MCGFAFTGLCLSLGSARVVLKKRHASAANHAQQARQSPHRLSPGLPQRPCLRAPPPVPARKAARLLPPAPLSSAAVFGYALSLMKRSANQNSIEPRGSRPELSGQGGRGMRASSRLVVESSPGSLSLQDISRQSWFSLGGSMISASLESVWIPDFVTIQPAPRDHRDQMDQIHVGNKRGKRAGRVSSLPFLLANRERCSGFSVDDRHTEGEPNEKHDHRGEAEPLVYPAAVAVDRPSRLHLDGRLHRRRVGRSSDGKIIARVLG